MTTSARALAAALSNYASFCFVLVFLSFFFPAFLLKHVPPIAEIMSSALEKYMGILNQEQWILRPSRPIRLSTIQPDKLDCSREEEILKKSHDIPVCLMQLLPVSSCRRRKWTKWSCTRWVGHVSYFITILLLLVKFTLTQIQKMHYVFMCICI